MHDLALILNIGTFREYDAWVRLLTKNNGICTAFAFGASKSKRRFAGCLDTLNIVHVSIEKSKRKDFLQLQETSLLESSTIRNDWRYIGIATNCLRFVEAVDIALETSEKSYNFITSFLQLLTSYPAQANTLPPLFRFKLASIQGYAPHIHSCVHCNAQIFPEENEKNTTFSVEEGGIVCKECTSHSFSRHIKISYDTLYFLQKVQTQDPENWLKQEIPLSIVQEYGKIIDPFIQYHLGLEWQNNRFIAL